MIGVGVPALDRVDEPAEHAVDAVWLAVEGAFGHRQVLPRAAGVLAAQDLAVAAREVAEERPLRAGHDEAAHAGRVRRGAGPAGDHLPLQAATGAHERRREVERLNRHRVAVWPGHHPRDGVRDRRDL